MTLDEIKEIAEQILREYKTDVTLVDKYGRPMLTVGVPLGISLRRNAVIRAPDGTFYKILSSPLVDYTDYQATGTYPSVKVIAKPIYVEDGEEKWLKLSTSAGTE